MVIAVEFSSVSRHYGAGDKIVKAVDDVTISVNHLLALDCGL
jgi:hypothetical protein